MIDKFFETGLGQGKLDSWALPFFVFAYLYLLWDRRKESSSSFGDDQIGLKLILMLFMVTTVSIAALGLNLILAYLLAGAPDSHIIRQGLGLLFAGGGLFALLMLLLLPRTNNAEFRRVERFALGMVATVAGMVAISSTSAFLSGLFNGAAWKTENAPQMATLLVYGGIGFLALMRYGTLSGWVAPARAPQLPEFGQQPQDPYQQQAYAQQPGQPGQPIQPAAQQPYAQQQPVQPAAQQQPAQPAAQQQPAGYPAQGGYNPQGGGGGYNPQGGGGGLPPPGGSGGGFPR